MLQAWQNDPDVEAWLVPVNPLPPRPFHGALSIKYVRTIATELTYLPQLVRQLASADVAHIFSASYSSFLLAPLPAILVAQALGVPVVLNYRSGEAPDHLQRSRIARWALRRVDCNVVPSRFLVGVFRTFGLDASVVPNLIDLDRFRFRPRDPLRPRLLSTRNFESLYNVACTVRAFHRVQQQYPEASLTLVGGGSEERALRALVADLGLRNVTFTGPVDPDSIAPLYADHDIYLQSPNIDNMPTSILEAYASGLPVVSTNAGGIPAILSDGEHGLLAPLNDDEMLAVHVLSLLDSPERARQIAHAALATCRGCTWSTVREQWLRVYRDLATRRETAAAAVMQP
jgi:glycosyltransferase involved in cell wall biosynthesis